MANGKKKHSAVKIVLIIVLIVGAVTGGLFLLAKRAQNIAKQLTMPHEAEVTRADLSQSVDGTGNLTIDDSIEIKYPSEIKISETLIEQGDDVNKGDIIATVDKSSVTSSIVKLQKELDDVKEQLKNKKKNKLTSYQIEELETRKTELETRLQLMQLYYENPFIIAPESGFVYSMGSSDSQTPSNQISLDNIDISSYLSNTSSDVNDTGSVPVKAADGEEDEGGGDEGNTIISDFSALKLTAPVKGETPVTSIDDNEFFTAEIKWLEGTEEVTDKFAPETTYGLLVVLTPKSGYEFSIDKLPELSGTDGDAQFEIIDGNLYITATYPATEAESTEPDPDIPPEPADPTSKPDDSGSIIPGLPDDFDLEKYLKQLQGLTGRTSGMDLSSLYGAMAGNLPSGVDYSDILSGSGSSGSSNFTDNTLLTVARKQNVKISIQVDELDILAISEGQAASIELDAIPDKVFEGKISKVALVGNTSSGTTKFQVDIVIPMDPSMRIGMSATASIVIKDKKDVLTLPLKAIQQSGDKLFVYMGSDEKGELIDERVIETGMSNGKICEILSGLNEGDKVYYIDASDNPFMQYLEEAEAEEAQVE